MEVIRLRNHEINREQWDHTVSRIPGGLIYARSWYLDAVAPGWQALATPDYSLMMPLPCRHKWGIRYLFQPLLTQQLGVLSEHQPTSFEVAAFLEALPAEFRLIEITLNRTNHPNPSPAFRQHTTYRLDLSNRYEELASHYSENARRNLRKTDKENFRFESGLAPGEFLDLLRQDPGKGSHILLTLPNRKVLLRLINTLLAHGAGMIYGVRDNDGRLICGLLMATHLGTHYYLAPACLPEGRESRAMFFLIDRFISQQAGIPTVLDFEGSDIASLARFYSGFGAQPESYPSFRVNRLPWPLNYLADRRIR